MIESMRAMKQPKTKPKKKVSPNSQNPRALRDESKRVRYITVGFRVSEEQNEMINAAVMMSGLSKQEYCYRRCIEQPVVVVGNPKVYKGLKVQAERLYIELRRITDASELSPETNLSLQMFAAILSEMRET